MAAMVTTSFGLPGITIGKRVAPRSVVVAHQVEIDPRQDADTNLCRLIENENFPLQALTYLLKFSAYSARIWKLRSLRGCSSLCKEKILSARAAGDLSRRDREFFGLLAVNEMEIFLFRLSRRSPLAESPPS